MTERDDDGFTLVELLVAMMILGVVFTVVSAAFFVSFNGAKDSNSVLEESQGGAFTSTYFAEDVQSARNVLRDATVCGGTTGQPLVGMTWTDLGVAQAADYILTDAPDGSKTLTRRRCGGSSTTSEVATQISSATVTCEPASCTRKIRLNLAGTMSGKFTIEATRRLP